jgi:hypothetical protein
MGLGAFFVIYSVLLSFSPHLRLMRLQRLRNRR